MSVGLHMAPDGSWNDPTGQHRNQHAIAEPLTGAVFDCLVELYQDGLAARGLIAPELDARGWTRDDVDRSMDAVHAGSAAAFARFAQGFHAALDDARHVVARCMAHVILTVRPETLSFPIVAARFLEAAAALGQTRHLPALLDHFLGVASIRGRCWGSPCDRGAAVRAAPPAASRAAGCMWRRCRIRGRIAPAAIRGASSRRGGGCRMRTERSRNRSVAMAFMTFGLPLQGRNAASNATDTLLE